MRSYFFGAAWAQARGLHFDSELLFVSAMLHDLALTPPFDSHALPFEEAGGHLARVFTAGLGWPRERRDRAAELIVLHMRDDVEPEQDPESRLLQVGTSADVSGRDSTRSTPLSSKRSSRHTPAWASPSPSSASSVTRRSASRSVRQRSWWPDSGRTGPWPIRWSASEGARPGGSCGRSVIAPPCGRGSGGPEQGRVERFLAAGQSGRGVICDAKAQVDGDSAGMPTQSLTGRLRR
ncbi:HD domain-containing protein [Streptomyces rimosus]|uniref:HD domain-containing protein n=1 Tax=Streptomyces rimosus TaxID=1927 RepID=UPI001F40F884|nr:HD domain-containing protein [Streptomyces rimosus]